MGQASLGAEKGLVMEFLMVGDLQGWPNHIGDDEPAIEITLVPARAFFLDVSDRDLQRLSRVYFPRTEGMLHDFEVLFFNHPRLDFLTPWQHRMMVGFAGTATKVPIAYPLSHWAEVQDPWLNSPLSDAFPVDVAKFASATGRGLPDEYPGLTRLRLEEGHPPLFSSFEPSGIFDSRIYQWNRPVFAKPGATTWVSMIDGPPALPEAPAFVSWPHGETETWAFGIHPNHLGYHWEQAGEWWEVVFLSMCYHTSGRGLLEFEESVNMMYIKSQFGYFRDSSMMFHSIVDFVSKVGANTADSERVLQDGIALRDEAESDYLEGEYEDARSGMKEAMAVVDRAMDEVMTAKDRALLWIYISEWFATVAVGLVSGFMLWSLMIRRRLYRTVATTRLG
jgi:hypothetical protein